MVFKMITKDERHKIVILNRMEEQEDPIRTGSDTMDNILRVILSSSMFLAMLLGFILDNTIPGTPEERGLIKWQNQHETGDCGGAGRLSVYDLPFITPWLQRLCSHESFTLHISIFQTKMVKIYPVSASEERCEIMNCVI